MTQTPYVPPHDEDSEKALIGSLLIDASTFRDVQKLIPNSSAFYILRHGLIYDCIRELVQNKKDIDILTVSTLLNRRGLIDEVGELYLYELFNFVPTAMNAVTYAQEVADRWLGRRMIQAASEIAQIGNAKLMDSDSKRSQAKSILIAAFEGTDQNKRKSWADSIDETLAQIYDGVWGDGPDLLTTGIPELDTTLDESLGYGKMIIVAAKPKRGKSTLMRGIALVNAKLKRPVAIFSHEEREHNIARTLISREALSTVSVLALRRMVQKEGREDEAAQIYSNLVRKGNDLKQLPIEAIYASGMTADDEVMEMERLRDVNGTRLFVVDYAQRIKSRGVEKDRRLELAKIGKTFADAAHDLNVTILLGSQVNDQGRTREAEDLENEMDAKVSILVDDAVLNVKSSAGIPVKLSVDLNRNGPSGEVEAIFNGAHRLFAPAISQPLGSVRDTMIYVDGEPRNARFFSN